MRPKTYAVKIKLSGKSREKLEALAERFKAQGMEITVQELLQVTMLKTEPHFNEELAWIFSYADHVEQEKGNVLPL